MNGSPTVSPTTAALCGSLPLPPCAPPSMYFLALSQAPPALAMKSASRTPVTVAPASRPPSVCDAEEGADEDRDGHGGHAGHDHLAQRGLGGDVDAPRAVRLGGAFHEARDLAELAAHLLDHALRGAADGGHRRARP